jgi:hypothetical protein
LEFAAIKNGSEVNRLRYFRTLMFAAGQANFAQPLGEAVARREAMDAMLAARRFQRKQGQWPTTLEQMSPEFLPKIPVDPFAGTPLRLKVDADFIRIYSIGRDRLDDGGESDGKAPDVGFVQSLLAR